MEETRRKVIWIYGLSGVGKTTLAKYIYDSKITKPLLLDGDVLRESTENKDHSIEGIKRQQSNIVLKILSNLNNNIIVSSISPIPYFRSYIKNKLGESLITIRLDASIEYLKMYRNNKGIYDLKENVIGIHIPFVESYNDDIVIDIEKNKNVFDTVVKELDRLGYYD